MSYIVPQGVLTQHAERRMMVDDTMESDAVLRRLKDRSFLRALALGLSAPGLLVTGAQVEIRTLRRGETIDHAWSSVGQHFTRATRRVVGERRGS